MRNVIIQFLHYDQDVTQGQFLNSFQLVWNLDFSFTWTFFFIKVKESGLPYY